jgi:hypothetical protein
LKTACIILGLIFFSVSSSEAQKYYYHQFEGGGAYGFTMPHRSSMSYLVKSRFAAINLAYSLKTDGSEPWHHEWRFPEIGVGYLITGLSNINIFGFAQSLYGFYSIPIYESDNLIFKYRFGTGFAYLTEKFNHRSNYYNNVIGSHLNSHIHFSVLLDYKLPDIPLYFSAGLAFNHFSNAAIKKPNLGLNLISFNTSAKYMLSDFKYSLPKRTLPFMNSEYLITAYYYSGTRQNATYENKNYFVHGLAAEFSIKPNFKRSFGFGTDITFDPSLKYQIDSNEESSYKGTADLFKAGIYLLHEVYLTEQLICLISAGTYAYTKFNYDKKFTIYNRFGLRYVIDEQFVCSFMIKSHAFIADFAEFGIGYRIKI